MPRPGPRPYDCVRRAWHSDRHQPMRGSIIQEIFRVANELHSPSTQRNREWQEKLPCVVFKVEEIMYSKANSEAEYMDLKTLGERTNDAIDTIIRRDEATEGDGGRLLRPCIEAALNLGCIPRRASRSQRHSNQVLYLKSSTQQAPAALPEIPESDEPHQGSPPQWLLPPPPPPPPPSHPNNQQGSASQFASWHSPSETQYAHGMMSVMPDASYAKGDSSHNSSRGFSFPTKNTLLHCLDQSPPTPHESSNWPKNPSVYPLYYGYSQPEMGFNLPLQRPQESMHNIPSASDNVEISFFQNHFGTSNDMDYMNKNLNIKGISEHPSSPSCDLSLCLGLPSASSLIMGNAWTHEFGDVDLANGS